MPKSSKPGYYAVRIGRRAGIYSSWEECEAQITGFAGAQYKKLSTEAEARRYMAAKPSTRTSNVMPVAFTSTINPDSVSASATRSVDADDQNFEVVYCDGACKGNGRSGSVAGIGVWWGLNDPRNISERCPGDQTNNRAELIAIIRILETTPRLKRPLLIKTDSNYSIQCVTSWIFHWTRNGFLAADKKPVKNKDVIKYLAALLHARRRASQTVQFKHVRGHVGIQGNEAADRLANLGTTMPMVPERDWTELEKEVLESLESVHQVKVSDDDLKAYADAFFNDDEVADLEDIPSSVMSIQAPGRQGHRDGKNNQNPASLVSQEFLQPPFNVIGSTAVRPIGEIHPVPDMRKLPCGGSSKPTQSAVTVQSASSKKPPKEELAIYASCLLGDNELSSFGKDGIFDSDF